MNIAKHNESNYRSENVCNFTLSQWKVNIVSKYTMESIFQVIKKKLTI